MILEWEEGESFQFCMSLEQFQNLRKAIATILIRVHALEMVKQIDL